MASLKRTIVRSMCKDGLRKRGSDKAYWRRQAHELFKYWWKNRRTELYGAAAENIRRNIQKHKLNTVGVLKKQAV